MCRLRNIAMRDYQESVTIGQTDTRTHRQTPDKVIPMCRYASQATQIALQVSFLSDNNHSRTGYRYATPLQFPQIYTDSVCIVILLAHVV